MSSPSPRPSVTHIAGIEASSSILHRLLREINDNDAPRSDPIFPTSDGLRSRNGSAASSRRASLNPNNALLECRKSSVWAKGGSAAEDARQKLRALDEARLSKQSTIAPQPDSPAASPVASISRKLSAAFPPSFFADIQYNRAATFPVAGPMSPTSEVASDLPCERTPPTILLCTDCEPSPHMVNGDAAAHTHPNLYRKSYARKASLTWSVKTENTR